MFIWEKDAKKANQLILKHFETSNLEGEVIHGFFTNSSRHFNQLLPIQPALDADNTGPEAESIHPQKALKPHCDTIPLCQSALSADDSWMNIPAFQLLRGELNDGQEIHPYDYNFSSKREISRLREKSKEDAVKIEALQAKNAEFEQKNLGLANTVRDLNSDIVDLKANQEKLETNYALLLERLEAMERARGHGHAPNL